LLAMLLLRMSAAIDRTPSLASQLPQDSESFTSIVFNTIYCGSWLASDAFHHTPICTIFSVSGSP
jgi:hypothetical protein